MPLNVTTEARERRQLALHIEVPKERVEKELRKAATKISTQYRLPGFRKGHAPYHIVVQQFGLQNLYSEFVDELGQEVFKEAIEQEGIKPYAIASIEDVQFEPLVYKLLVPLEPEVKLGDYRAIRVEEEAPEVDASLIDQQIKTRLENLAGWQAVESPSKPGDTMTIDVRSVIAATDESPEVVVLDETDWEVTPDEENPMDPPGFDAALVGMKAGESKSFTLAWPAESRSVHAGKAADFTVTVHEVTSWETPELTDALAQKLDPEVSTVAELRAKLSEAQANVDTARREDAYISKVLDEALAVSTIDYPPVMIEDQIDSMMTEFERRLRQFGIENLDNYFSQVGQDKAEYRESLREEATKTAERSLVLSEIVKAENIPVDGEDIEKRIRRVLGKPKTEEERAALAAVFRREDLRDYFTNQILYDRALARLKKLARGEEVAAPGEIGADEVEDAGWEEEVDESMALEASNAIEALESELDEMADAVDAGEMEPSEAASLAEAIGGLQDALATTLLGEGIAQGDEDDDEGSSDEDEESSEESSSDDEAADDEAADDEAADDEAADDEEKSA